MALARTTRKALKSGTRLYDKAVNYTARGVNGVMRPLTRKTKGVAKKIPLVGDTMAKAVGLPRKITRGGASVIRRVPRAVKDTAQIGTSLLRRVLLDPFIAIGLTPSGTVMKLKPSKRLSKKRSKRPARR